MEAVVEEDRGTLQDIDEFFCWDEEEGVTDEFYNEFEQFASHERPNELPDYANDIRNKLQELLSGLRTREPRYM